MNIGLFGGTFDPIHHGHVALARGAKERFELGCVYFAPANIPPHKQQHPVSSYFHRYAMVALATMNEKAFVPSLLEAPGEASTTAIAGKKGQAQAGANYTIDTVRRLKETLRKSDRLFFLIGIDAFKEIARWHEAERFSANVNSSWPAVRDIPWPMWPTLCQKHCGPDRQ